MALTGIQIFKLLPKKNCGECGVPTCLAFAMKLAAGKAELSACPYVSEETQAKLAEASAPPIRQVSIGSGEKILKTGGETVLFRHEKRFENPTGIALIISDAMTEAEIGARINRFNLFNYERVGLTLRPDLLALKCESNDAEKYKALVSQVKQQCTGGIILWCQNPEITAAALSICAEQKPLLYAATEANLEAFASLAKQNGCPVAVKGKGLEECANLTERMNKAGINDIVIDTCPEELKQAFTEQVQIRSTTLTGKFRPLGYPTIVFPGELTSDPMKEALYASIFVAKYGGIIVLSDFQGHSLFPLLVERMNLFTDPQRPLATNEGIYEIGGPDENAPVILTCNFSLTYFIISGEIETSRVPSYLLIKDTEGLSVMTSWAAGKFVADTIGPFVKKCGIANKLKHRKLIIPGYIAAESGGLEDELPDWEIQIGPREGAHLPAYLKNWKSN